MKHSIKEKIRSALYTRDSSILSIKEYNKAVFKEKQARLESQMLVTAHSLEKGMGIRETRKGYGQKKATNLINYLSDYCKRGYDCSLFPFVESYKMIEAYIDYQLKDNVNIDSIVKQFEDFKSTYAIHIQETNSTVECGFDYLPSESLLTAKTFDFEKFASLRHSIRDYKPEIVSEEIVLRAIEIANHSPSACNRQPVKVYCTKSLDIADKVDDLITGTSGFKKSIYNFAVVTCDRSYFSGQEIYQWYVNGGIYLSFLVLAFHSLGIGSCIMQWFAFHNTEKELKELMHIKDTEAIIAIVGYGYLPDNVKCIKAQRKDPSEVVTFV